jgi:signal transduction histidine kinase
MKEPIVHSRPSGLSPNRRAQRVLVGGFLLMIALLGADGVIGFRSLLSIRANVSALTENQFRNVVLIDEVQRAQSALSSVLYRLSAGSRHQERAGLETRVDNIEQSLKSLFAAIPANDPDLALWRDVEKAYSRVTTEADRILALPPSTQPNIENLLLAREQLVSATAHLIRANHARAEITKQQIEQISSRQLIRDAILLSACLAIACLCAWLILRTATRLYSQITEQTEELGRVSWQLLEKQEHLARRLSHELHDELGQSLTALKTNFTRHAVAPCVDPAWMTDCSQLLKDSIRSAHEISQLLRPTILDDFGLDSALAWLCERFEERQRIEVEYVSDFHGRLDPQTETHVFRIAQEALTNVARHSSASKVSLTLLGIENELRLRISDNGLGLPNGSQPAAPHFGLTGMKARARSLEGELTLRSFAGRGTEIDVIFPRKEHEYEETHPNPFGG